MRSDSRAASAAFADALEDLAAVAAAPGARRDVRVTVDGPHDAEQRTVRIPADVADWITELVRSRSDTVRQSREHTDRNDGDGSGQEPGGGPDDGAAGPEHPGQWWG